MAGNAPAPLLPNTTTPAIVDMDDEDEIQAMEGTEWKVAHSTSAKNQANGSGGTQPIASGKSQDSAKFGVKSGRRAAALKKRVITASRMPELPSTHRKIIVRPRDGLDLRKTNAYDVSSAIYFHGGRDHFRRGVFGSSLPQRSEHEVAVYAAAEGNYNEGVIRKVERDISDADLVNLIVHPGNPTARGAKRIRETGSVIILFDGEQVPSYIRMGPAIVRCDLYKKQFEVCSKCTPVGHRADVCPTPMVNVCRNCGAKYPAQGHS
ncbi:hypothetical protein MTO96_031297 [Rhipicephalus appendiculatus]